MKLCASLKKEKKLILSQFSGWDQAKLSTLDLMMQAKQLWIDCEKKVAKEGLVISGERGAVRSHPLLNTIRDCRAQYLTAVKLLGLHLDENPRKPGRPTSYRAEEGE